MKIKKLKDKKKISSQRWLMRHMNDPFVQEARRRGYRSRAAFKILQIEEKFELLKPTNKVLDLGAAPGGWSDVLIKKIWNIGHLPECPDDKCLIAIDLLDMEPINHTHFIKGDFMEPEIKDQIRAILNEERVDAILSDMAPSLSGQKNVDSLRMMGLLEDVIDHLPYYLKTGGHFIGKFFQGPSHDEVLKLLRQNFEKVRCFIPKASRPESKEQYVVCQHYRGDFK